MGQKARPEHFESRAGFVPNEELAEASRDTMVEQHLQPEQRSNKALLSQSAPATFLAMSTLQEIKAAIDSLSPADRAELERMLRQPAGALPPTAKLPDQAARRRRILGDKVLPNLVIEARQAESA